MSTSLGTFVIGDDWLIGFTIADADGLALDLTAAGRTVTLRLKRGSTEVQRSTATVGQYEWFTDGTDGKVYFLVTAAASLLLPGGFYAASLFVTDAAPLDVGRDTPTILGEVQDLTLAAVVPTAGHPA